MTKQEIIKYSIQKGWTCNTNTGEVFSHKGNLIKAKNSEGRIICSIIINKKAHFFKAHQFVWIWCGNDLPKEGFVIDHVNQNLLDNSISNLRIITHQENLFNTSAKGYYFDKRKNKYRGQIVLNGKDKYLGLFNTEEEAQQAYQNAKKVYHVIK